MPWFYAEQRRGPRARTSPVSNVGAQSRELPARNQRGPRPFASGGEFRLSFADSDLTHDEQLPGTGNKFLSDRRSKLF
jgi:hypothetical protein